MAMPLKDLAMIMMVEVVAVDITIHDRMYRQVGIRRLARSPSLLTESAAKGEKKRLTRGTMVAIQEPSVVVVGILEPSAWSTGRIGDVHPVVIPVWVKAKSARQETSKNCQVPFENSYRSLSRSTDTRF